MCVRAGMENNKIPPRPFIFLKDWEKWGVVVGHYFIILHS
jgi:hypothetical protein